ncbi:hypothetical protein [Hydrogenophaga sp.]|uniref:hypothetical protein n=1 Tax=Hydrogenophaga sp. TaxID=1904254 RepID=UPI002FC66269
MKHSNAFVPTALASAAMLALVACGGGGDDAPTSLTGMVAVDGPVRNAVVCLDLNANNVCDSGEPASAPTGADGAYSVDPSTVTEQQLASSSLIAPMVPGGLADPGTTIDMADGQATAENPYVLRQVPGKAGQINPLTTLVAAGVLNGMTEAVARANAAEQLGIVETKIDNYQDDPAFNDAVVVDNARLMASAVATTLEDGVPLVVGDQKAAIAADQNDLRLLRYTDGSNFNYQDFMLSAKAAGEAGLSLVDGRVGQVGGVATDASVLYNQAYLTSNGWLRCDSTVLVTATQGVPNRSTFCNAQTAVNYRKNVSVAGRPMADVVSELQSDSENFINTGLSTTGLLAALGAAQFPAGSNLRPGLMLTLTQPIFINSLNTDGRPQAEATSLAQLIAAKPAAGVNLATAAGSLSLGISSDESHNLRVAFTDGSDPTQGSVQYYDCDLAGNVASNCEATRTGRYIVEEYADGKVKVMRFTGFTPTVMDHVRHYVEVNTNNQVNGVTGGDWVFVARQRKPDVDSNLSSNKRLNGTAWTAMKALLGI